MKFFKWILIVIIILAGGALIAAIFLPGHVHITAKTEIDKPALKLFHGIATFQDRPEWDPWVTTDSTTKVEIIAEERYVGSSYQWDGEKVKTGKVVVDSIVYGEFISSSIGFGGRDSEATVIWELEENPNGSTVTWSFDSDAAFPIGRLYMAIGKNMMQKSFEQGLANLKAHYESKDILLSSLSEIKEVVKPAMFAMVAEASGTMEDLVAIMGTLYGDVYQEIMTQGLDVSGPSFGYYYNYDNEAGTVSIQCGFPVASKGISSEKVIARSFPEVKVLQGIHTGPYDEFENSYGIMMEYVQENDIGITWESFEEYLVDPNTEWITTLWQTAISFIVDE